MIVVGNIVPSGHTAGRVFSIWAYLLRAMEKEMIIDDTYGYESKYRCYKDFSPTLRGERFGLKVLCKYVNLNENNNNKNIEKRDILNVKLAE